MPPETELKALVGIAKQRWVIERDYEELKQELGLGHYEGRGWRGFHHHATLCIAAYGFLVAERSRFPPSAQIRHVGLRAPEFPGGFKPRGSPPPGEAKSLFDPHAPKEDRNSPSHTASALPCLLLPSFVTQ